MERCPLGVYASEIEQGEAAVQAQPQTQQMDVD